jgi:hypothetical protein
MKPIAFPFAANSRVARTGAPGDKSTPGGGVSNPAPSPRATPRRPEVEQAGCNDVAIYELTGPFTTWAWLCEFHAADYRRRDWTTKKLPGKVLRCDRCVNNLRGSNVNP